MDPPRGDFHQFFLRLELGRRRKRMTPHLDPRIQGGVDLKIQFQDKVGILPLGAEKRVARAGDGQTHDFFVFDPVQCLAPSLNPTGQVAAIE